MSAVSNFPTDAKMLLFSTDQVMSCYLYSEERRESFLKILNKIICKNPL